MKRRGFLASLLATAVSSKALTAISPVAPKVPPVTLSVVAAGAISGSEIAACAVTADKIAAGSIVSAQLNI